MDHMQKGTHPARKDATSRTLAAVGKANERIEALGLAHSYAVIIIPDDSPLMRGRMYRAFLLMPSGRPLLVHSARTPEVSAQGLLAAFEMGTAQALQGDFPEPMDDSDPT